MRPLALIATVLSGSIIAGAAEAQSLHAPLSASANLNILNSAAFAPRSYAPQGPGETVDPTGAASEYEAYVPGEGLVRWMTGETQFVPAEGGAINSLRFSVGGPLRGPGGQPLDLTHGGQFQAGAYDVTLSREWPAALAYEGQVFGVDVTPHAGLGMTSLGGSAEAGATLRLMQTDAAIKERLNALGVKDGASTFGDKGRWYLFAAASGRAVGLNMTHNDAGWDRAGVTTDQSSTLVGDTQFGVGWRKGAMQTSFGYIHREVKGANNPLWGADNKADSMVAFSFQVRPRN